MSAPVIQFGPVAPESIPPIFRRAAFDYAPLVSALSGSNQTFQLLVPDGLEVNAFRVSLIEATKRAGLCIKTRAIGSEIYVRRYDEPRKRRNTRYAERNVNICAAVDDGKTLEDVASEFNLTRQRVQQIYHRERSYTRSDDLNATAAAYLEAVGDKRRCFRCREELPDGERRYVGACRACRKAVDLLGMVASRLRKFRAAGLRRDLIQAMYHIRKHRITPDDLRFA